MPWSTCYSHFGELVTKIEDLMLARHLKAFLISSVGGGRVKIESVKLDFKEKAKFARIMDQTYLLVLECLLKLGRAVGL